MNILSLFDGMSCGQIALERAGITVDNYYASEIDKYAIGIAKKNYPNTVELGDVTKWREWSLPKIDVLLGGSPCQGFSVSGKKLNFDDPRSRLFFEYVDILKHFKPTWFLLENVKMKKEWQDIISEHLGVQPIEINSALVSAQNRKRLYWTNIPGIEQPENRYIYLRDIIEHDVEEQDQNFCINYKYYREDLDKYVEKLREYANTENNSLVQVGSLYSNNAQAGRIYSTDGKAVTLRAEGGGVGAKTGLYLVPVTFTERRTEEAKRIRKEYMAQYGKDYCPRRAKELVVREDGKANCITTAPTIEHIVVDESYVVRKLTPVECERLQNVPDNYTEGVSTTQRYRMLGNGWTVDVISHIFSYLPIPVSLSPKHIYVDMSLWKE